jgi:TonB family protein
MEVMFLAVKNITVLVLMLFSTFSCFGQTNSTDSSATRTPTRIRVSERVLDDLALKKLLPQLDSTRQGWSKTGVVTIAVLVDYDGTVKSASLTAGDPELGDVAISAIKQWRYRPYKIEGYPVQIESRVVMKFTKKHAELVLGDR